MNKKETSILYNLTFFCYFAFYLIYLSYFIYNDINKRFRQLIKIKYKFFLSGRTTGIEPAHGGSTIHCLNPLGHVRLFKNLFICKKKKTMTLDSLESKVIVFQVVILF